MKEKKAAFRECFFKIGELRSLLPQGAPLLALTATATKDVLKDTSKGLGMKPNTLHVTASPDRPNIYLYRIHVDKNVRKTFQWLIDQLRSMANLTPRTIVYCKSQKDCGVLYKHFKLELGDQVYFPPDAQPFSCNMLIGMYHANTLQKHKDRVSESLFESNGTCRVVFASTALGMGVNFPDVKQVVHYGPPRHVEDFMQEIGRAGRNGEPAKSILSFTGVHLRKCEEAMKNYAKKEVCLRQTLLQKFDISRIPNKGTHSCCIVCHRQCQCGEKECEVALPVFYSCETSEDDQKPQMVRQVQTYQKEELKELLNDYKSEQVAQCPVYLLPSETTTGFSDALIKSMLERCQYISSVEDILKLTPVFKRQHALDILHMVRDVFQDFEIEVEYVDVEDDDTSAQDYDLEYGGLYDSDSSENSVSSELSGVVEI